ncbi:glucosamine inositolphosphorylceramide transferase family protein [Teichococcus aestuarii]|uniref:glucosamine inositolphosphorylceramide transferase family protein n=1 Tax=Teichococcus aestuarii TaxID=568898 RepID=UPI003605F194
MSPWQRELRIAGGAAVAAFAEKLQRSLGPAVRVAVEAEPASAPPDADGAETVLLRVAPGKLAAAGGRAWRIVDEHGEFLCSPRFGLRQCCRAPGLLSLHLVEDSRAGAPGRVLAEAHLGAWRPHPELREAAMKAAAALVAEAIRHPGRATRPWAPLPRKAADWPGRWRLAYGLKRARDKLTSENWAVGVTEVAPEELGRSRIMPGIRWTVPPSAEGYHADPFPWPGRLGMALCEYFDHATGLGRLRALRLGAEAGAVLAEELPVQVRGHLSYPFCWEEDGRVFCTPEMAASRRQVIFELSPDAPPRAVATVAEEVEMADPTFFRHGGLCWLAYTDVSFGPHDNLCLMFAESLEGPWTPHPANPVKIDIRSSRPAGPLLAVGGRLLRPAQDCAASYGAALVVNEILECTPSSYREKPVAVLSPDPEGPFPHGLHTIAAMADGRFLVDGKRISLSPGILLRRLARRLPSADWLRRPGARPIRKPAAGLRG